MSFKKILNKKTKEELIVFAKIFNIVNSRNMKKEELVTIILQQDRKSLKKELEGLSWFDKYYDHVYALIGVLLAIFLYIVPYSDIKDAVLVNNKNEELILNGDFNSYYEPACLF